MYLQGSEGSEDEDILAESLLKTLIGRCTKLVGATSEGGGR